MTVAHTSDTEIVLALRAIEQYGSQRAAARHLGLDGNVISKRVKLAEERGLTVGSTVVTEEDRLREKLRRAEADVQRLTRETETADTIRESIFKFAARQPNPVPWLEAKRRHNGTPEVPILMASDWHWGEVVNPVEMGGVNAFNREIAKQRAELFFDTAIALTERDGGDVPGIVLVLGGDMITGFIHEELAETNDLTNMEACYEVTDVLIAGITKLADRFKRVFIPSVVGNHGREGKKPQYKRAVFHSYEWLVYQTLARHFRSDKRVRFLIPGETDAFFVVNGIRFLLTHGDNLGVKGGDGIIGALGPITRGAFKLGNSEKQIGRDFDYLLIGHYHFPLWLPTVVVNGSIKGYDEYARLRLRVPYAPASQMLFRVHPEFGITSRREIILQDPLKEVLKDTKWLEWQEV